MNLIPATVDLDPPLRVHLKTVADAVRLADLPGQE